MVFILCSLGNLSFSFLSRSIYQLDYELKISIAWYCELPKLTTLVISSLWGSLLLRRRYFQRAKKKRYIKLKRTSSFNIAKKSEIHKKNIFTTFSIYYRPQFFGRYFQGVWPKCSDRSSMNCVPDKAWWMTLDMVHFTAFCVTMRSYCNWPGFDEQVWIAGV